jgi:2-polyprenyl-6-methoxyphenol hydroxylase-like FAD-dependent oxidoreductase
MFPPMAAPNTGSNRLDSLVIVGSGPVGMVSALLLRDRFERVVVLERQPKKRFLTTRGFTFPIVFSPAAIRVLERVGAWEAIQSERSPYFGVVIHMRLLGRDVTWTAKKGGIYAHWRDHIVSSLHDRLCEESIDVQFGARVEDIDFTRKVCTEAKLGEVPFDVLLGADGIHSQTRSLMAAAHPRFGREEFRSTLLDRWYAYRLPARGVLADKLGGEPKGHASHVYVDNLPQHPAEKFRVITTAMTQPRDEISVVVKYGADLPVTRARELNDVFFSPLVAAQVLEYAWDEGVAGTYEHVQVPTFQLNSALLVGDAAHGFESTGDLINVGLGSVASLPEFLDNNEDVPEALSTYDDTVGRSLRAYSRYALRRSREKIDFEVAAFELGALLRLNEHHPSLWGIFEEDFEIREYMKGYERDRRRLRAAGAAMSGGALLAGLTRWRARA